MKNQKWTIETCIEISKNYTTRRDFMLNCSGAYSFAYDHKLLDKMTWLKYKQHKPWTQETCYQEAQKYTSKIDFKTHSNGAYHVARKNGWLINYIWFVPKNLYGNNPQRKDNIYSYEFLELNSVYIGRTIDIIKRDKEHRTGRGYNHIKESAVYKFAKEHDIDIPEPKILETDITILEGQELEGMWVERYREQGWNILNKAKCGKGCGALGTLGRKWTKNKVFEESKKYTSRNDFAKSCKGAYKIALKSNWLDEMTWLIKNDNKYPKKECTKSSVKKWTKELVFEVSKKYNSKIDFKKFDNVAYTIALKNKWLNDMIWLKPKRKWTKPSVKKWTKELVFEVSKKYKKRSELKKEKVGAYHVARKNGWLDELFPKE